MPKLDPNSHEFRAAGHRLIDWVADFLDHPDDYPVLAHVQPGDVEKQFATRAADDGKPYDALIADFQSKIVPGITHWNHPAFFAYFANTGSQAGILAELLAAAVNGNGMMWKTSPSFTEIETLTLRWLRDALGLPDNLFGIINDTASINTFLAIASAREAIAPSIRRDGFNGERLRVYCSEHTHSSIDKAVIALGIGQNNLVKILTDDDYRMRPELLAGAIARDRANGLTPCAIVATLGTTSVASIDPLRAIGEIAARETLWLHVDAAYGGPAAICPEFRSLWDGIEYGDSIVVNPHKWLFTPMDCSVLYTRKPDVLRAAFTLAEVPAYYMLGDTAEINYMDYGLQLGRRFRALKLWMIFEHYGLERMRAVIRDHVAYIERLAGELRKRNDIEILAPPSLSLLVFRKVVAGDEEASERETNAALQRMNDSGRLFVSSTRLRGKLGIRVAIGNGGTEWQHVERVLSYL
jgi:aromatic-L-amino-acid decarboxylase